MLAKKNQIYFEAFFYFTFMPREFEHSCVIYSDLEGRIFAEIRQEIVRSYSRNPYRLNLDPLHFHNHHKQNFTTITLQIKNLTTTKIVSFGCVDESSVISETTRKDHRTLKSQANHVTSILLNRDFPALTFSLRLLLRIITQCYQGINTRCPACVIPRFHPCCI